MARAGDGNFVQTSIGIILRSSLILYEIVSRLSPPPLPPFVMISPAEPLCSTRPPHVLLPLRPDIPRFSRPLPCVWRPVSKRRTSIIDGNPALCERLKLACFLLGGIRITYHSPHWRDVASLTTLVRKKKRAYFLHLYRPLRVQPRGYLGAALIPWSGPTSKGVMRA